MLLSGQLLLEASAGRCRIAPGVVRVEDEQIVEVIEGEIAAGADAGSDNTLISPGFLDAHLHLPQFDMIGAHGMPLLQWLSDVTFPAEMKWQDANYAREMATRVVRQLIRSGTTGICAFATVHHDSTVAAIQVAADCGIRGVIGQVLMDRQAPPELCRPSRQLLDESNDLVNQFPAGHRLAAAVTPRFAVSCTQDLLAGAGQIARESGALVQTHLAETVRECELVKELFDGKSYVDVYDQCDLLTARAIHGHGVHLCEADRQTVAQRKAVIAHCPTANCFLGSGTMNLAAMLEEGICVALGSDIGAGYERSMVRVARSMILSAAAMGNQPPQAAAAWHRITAGNADALGWDDVGRLRPGLAADLVVIEPDIPWLQTDVDPLAMLMFAWDDSWVKRVLDRGEVTAIR